MKQFVHKLSVSGKKRDKEKIPGDQGKQDSHGWSGGKFSWAQCLWLPGKSDIDIFNVQRYGI